MPIEEDFGRWVYWWEFNKDRYLRLKESMRDDGVTTASDDFYMGAGKVVEAPLAPSDAEVRQLALPALLTTLKATRNREVTMACLMAIAKIARDFGQVDAIDVIEPHLARGDRAVRGTAALALGISEDPRATFKLIALLRDTKAGRSLVQRESVDDWTRSFAAYGLGNLVHRADAATKQVVFQHLRAVLFDEDLSTRDLRVAVVNALGAINPSLITPKGRRVAQQGLDALADYFRADLGRGSEALQSHAALSIARLATRVSSPPTLAYYKQMFLRELSTRGSRGQDIRRSSVLALGALASPVDGSHSPDFEIAETLERVRRRSKDRQEGLFALIAMGQVGGEWNRERLLEVLRVGSKAIERPWAALALGVMLREAQDERGVDRADTLVIDRLRAALTATKNPDAISSAAIALGLARCEDAALDLRATLAKFQKRDLIAGCTCIALAMLGDAESVPQIQAVVERAQLRPALMRRAAVALGILRDQSAAPRLVELLSDDANYAGIASLSVALSLIGDRDSIPALVDLMRDETRSHFGRSMAAAAIGGIVDRTPMPWNEKFSANVNYLATVPTFTSGGYGVFEIL